MLSVTSRVPDPECCLLASLNQCRVRWSKLQWLRVRLLRPLRVVLLDDVAARNLALVLVHSTALNSRSDRFGAALSVEGSQLSNLELQLLNLGLKLDDPAALLLDLALMIFLFSTPLLELLCSRSEQALLEADLRFQFFCLLLQSLS